MEKRGDSTPQQSVVMSLGAVVYSCPQDFFTRYGYTRDSVLGKGMMGQVVLAKPPAGASSQQLEAVKTFSKKSQDDGGENRKYFLQEVATLQHVKHKHIMGNIEAMECPNEYVLCMPYYKKGNLKSHLPTLTIELTDKYLIQLTSAVHHLHKRHIVHRDIKPQNVLISDDDDVILSDFGLACVVVSDSSSCVKKCGTRGYMAPELEEPKGKSINLYKCDMYSLGVVLWNMIFRRTKTPDGLDYLACLRLQPHIPECYKTLIENLLCEDTDLRWDCHKLVSTLCAWPSMVGMLDVLSIG